MASIDLFDHHHVKPSPNNTNHNSTSTPFTISSPLTVLAPLTTEEDVSYGESSEFDKYVSVIAPIVLSVLGLLGLFGNSLVIFVVMLEKQMRSTTNILILSLAVADLLFVLFNVSALAAEYATHVWFFGDVGCKIAKYADHTCAFVSVYTLVLMAVDRYLAVVHALRSIILRTERKAWIAIAVVWIVSLCGNTPFFIYVVKVDYVERGQERSHCNFDDDNKATMTFKEVFYTSFFFIGFVIPLGITIVMYGLIVRKLLCSRVPGEGGESAESLRVKKRVTVLVITVTVIFAVCWMPIHVFIFWSHFGAMELEDVVKEILHLATNCLLLLNSSINPVLYAFMSQTFYQNFRKYLKYLCCGLSSRRMEGRFQDGAGPYHVTPASSRQRSCVVSPPADVTA